MDFGVWRRDLGENENEMIDELQMQLDENYTTVL